MTENMKAFMDAIQNNEELKEKFDEISNKEQAEQKDCTNEYIALARACGITLTKEDFIFDEEKLSDEDLENVSGGLTRIDRWAAERSVFETIIRDEKREKSQQAQSQGQTQDQTQDQN